MVLQFLLNFSVSRVKSGTPRMMISVLLKWDVALVWNSSVMRDFNRSLILKGVVSLSQPLCKCLCVSLSLDLFRSLMALVGVFGVFLGWVCVLFYGVLYGLCGFDWCDWLCCVTRYFLAVFWFLGIDL